MDIQKAFDFAYQKHRLQKRKGSGLPYFVHLLEVAKILDQNDANETTIIAGLLHDTLEDTNTMPVEILENFGKEVFEIVKGETENKSLEWVDRKTQMIDILEKSSVNTKMVKCADMLSNIRETIIEYQKKGEDFWKIFNAPKQQIEWYYKQMLSKMKGIEHTNMYNELKNNIEVVFNN